MADARAQRQALQEESNLSKRRASFSAGKVLRGFPPDALHLLQLQPTEMLITQSRTTLETATGPLGIEIIQPSKFPIAPTSDSGSIAHPADPPYTHRDRRLPECTLSRCRRLVRDL